jgi:putative membrane protein
MRAKAFNPQIFLEFLCYSVFAGLMLYLAGSGKYLSYVTPRMAPYLYFTAIVMGIWAFAALGRLFRPQHKVRSAHCFVLVIPILLFLLPHNPMSASNLSGSYVGGSAFSASTGQSSYGSSSQQYPSEDSGLNAATSMPAEDPMKSGTDTTGGDSGMIDGQTGVPEDEYSTGLPGLDVTNKKITVSNDDFGMWFSEIYLNMQIYEGYTVVMTGFVFKDSDFLKEDEFVPARLMMTCCVADLAPAGLLCKYDKVSELETDSWVTVEGTLFIGEYEYNGQVYDDPQISVTKITPAEEVEGYVYPY